MKIDVKFVEKAILTGAIGYVGMFIAKTIHERIKQPSGDSYVI